MKVGEQAVLIEVPVGCLDPVEGRIEQQQDIVITKEELTDGVEVAVTVRVGRQ